MASTSAESGDQAAPVVDVYHQGNKYKGVNLMAMQLGEIYEGMEQHWETREDDIYIITYPKSGTHWIFEIVALVMNGGDVDKIDRNPMLYAMDLAISSTIEGVPTATPGYKIMEKWDSPRIMVSHMLEEFAPEQIKKSKIIYFSRNPKDVSVYWFKFLGPMLPAHMDGWKGFLPFFLSDEMFSGSWFRHVKGWFAHQNDSNVLVCKYEDFIKDLRGSVQRVANFLGRTPSEEQLRKIVELIEMKGVQETHKQIEESMGDAGLAMAEFLGQLPYLRRGKVGGWKDRFTKDENEYFDKVYSENMKGTGINFEFEL